MADSKVSEKELCNYCHYCKKKTSKKIIKCQKCNKAYHNSCADRVMCCESKIIEQKTTYLSDDIIDEEETDIPSLTVSTEELLAENQELKEMNKSLNKQIVQLKQDIKRIQKENELCKAELRTNIEDKQKVDIKDFISTEIEKKFSFYLEDLNALKLKLNKLEFIRECDKPNPKNNSVEKNKIDKEIVSAKKHQYNSTTKNDNPGTSTQTNIQELQNKQKQIMNKIINLESSPTRNTNPDINKTASTVPLEQNKEFVQNNNNANNHSNSESNNDGFTLPRQRKKLSQKTIIGENENSTKLRAVNPLSWIFISRLEPETTTEDVSNYLKEYDIKVLQCYKLKTFSSEIAAFKIAVNNTDEDKVFCGEIWPKKTIVRPYDSTKLKNFQRIPPVSLNR